MSLSSIWKKIKKPVLGIGGALLGSALLPGLGTALGATISGATGGALGSAAGSALDAATDSGSWAGGGTAREVPMPQADVNGGPPAFVFQPPSGSPQGSSGGPAAGAAGPTGPSSASQVIEIVGKGLAGGLSSLPAAAMGAGGQWLTNRQQMEQADKQMAFQQNQSETGYQRAVTDMRAAGLNPMLAYSQGPEAGFGGAQAQLGNVTASAMQAAQGAQAIRNAQAEEYKAYAQAENINADTDLMGRRGENISAQTANYRMSTEEAQNRVYKLMKETELLAQQAYIGESTMKHQIVIKQVQSKLAQIDGLMAETDLSKSENMQDYFQSWWGRTIAPFLRDILGVSGEVGRWSNRFH